MADSVVCLAKNRVVLLEHGREPEQLRSARSKARVVGITRGRKRGEVYCAVRVDHGSSIVLCGPGESDGQRIFHSAETRLLGLDFSFADQAFACAVESTSGTSALGILADDGRGLRTVTEGDVLDREPRWAPGGLAQIVYASAGIGRTKSGARAGRSPFSLHRLRLEDNTVEVLVSDAQYDYSEPVVVSESLLYAIRRAYENDLPKLTIFGALIEALRSPVSYLNARFRRPDRAGPRHPGLLREARNNRQPLATDASELVRITPNGTEVLAQGVRAFDVGPSGDLIYANDREVFVIAADKGSRANTLAELEQVEALVIVI